MSAGKPNMDIFDAVYVGDGNMRVYREVKEGEQIRMYIPPELMADYLKNNPEHPEIHTDTTNPDGSKV